MNALTYYKPTGLVLSAKAVGPGMAPGAPSSDGFPVVTSSLLWLDRNQKVYSDTAGTTPSTVGGAVARWDGVNAAWGLGTYSFQQSTGANQPTLQSGGLQSDGTNDLLVAGSAISLGTGAFTCYWVQSRTASGQIMTALGHGTLNNGIVVFGTATYIVNDAGAGMSSTDNDTALCIRRMRKSGGDAWLKIGTGSEVNFTSGTYTGNLTLNSVLGRSAEVNNTNSRTRQIVLVGANITPGSADDLAIIAKLQALESGAAWS